jgi:hypothetical protein
MFFFFFITFCDISFDRGKLLYFCFSVMVLLMVPHLQAYDSDTTLSVQFIIYFFFKKKQQSAFSEYARKAQLLSQPYNNSSKNSNMFKRWLLEV